jgi:hypothetical protein
LQQWWLCLPLLPSYDLLSIGIVSSIRSSIVIVDSYPSSTNKQILVAMVVMPVTIIVMLSIDHWCHAIYHVFCCCHQYEVCCLHCPQHSNSQGIECCLPCRYTPSQVSRQPSTACNMGLSPFPSHSNGLVPHLHTEGIWVQMTTVAIVD